MESGSGDWRSFEIHPEVVARELALETEQIQRALKSLHEEGQILYRPPFRGRATVLLSRADPEELPIDGEALREKWARDSQKLEFLLRYAESNRCRQQELIRYFGGKSAPCGHCDQCNGEGPKKKSRAPSNMSANISAKMPAAPTPLFEKLREWRRKKASEENIPAFAVLHDRALQAIASVRPQSPEELSDCYSLGAVKLQRYGKELLEMIRSKETSEEGNGV